MMTVTYFSVTIIIIDQNIRLTMPIDMQLIERQWMVPGEGIAHGIERAGADIAEDDANRANCEFEHAAVVAVVGVRRGMLPADCGSWSVTRRVVLHRFAHACAPYSTRPRARKGAARWRRLAVWHGRRNRT